ncbi:tumor necrosis factor alpha-induced protein 2-like isoform X2 [Paramormyrops kingsleyae]|uniref:Tumor necrosis factor alpha-induced protein 2-like n=1 Tax=Paramormyrops kingsleyae TaxID=1676925 RepID=A0A3B3SAN1_9TELE|nr:tumor necrosis factor alpha-induced protein 2-like isoform X1 [Paramormyrops kingsleyae]
MMHATRKTHPEKLNILFGKTRGKTDRERESEESPQPGQNEVTMKEDGAEAPHEKKIGGDGRNFFPRLTVKFSFMQKRKSDTSVRRSPSSEGGTQTAALPFEENLAQLRLWEAGQQLIAREEQLFGSPGEKEAEWETEEAALRKHYKALLLKVQEVVRDTLDCKTKESSLKSAVSAIMEEEKQDQQWRKAMEGQVPPWRPQGWRQTHDRMLEELVTLRINRLDKVQGVENLSSSLKTDICKMGKLVKDDLLRVVQNVKDCYPEEFDICNLYARLYHQAFSERLQDLATSPMEIEDCTYFISWVYDHYPNNVLRHKSLQTSIDLQALGPLLPEDVVQPLEQQYLSHAESQLGTWISKALTDENAAWKKGDLPKKEDGYYTTAMTFPVIKLVDDCVKEAGTILGDIMKAQRIVCQLGPFLQSYRESLKNQMKVKQINVKPIIKGSLSGICQLRDYIVVSMDPQPEDVRVRHLDIVNDMEKQCYKYLINSIQSDIKPHYNQLGTASWLSDGSVMTELLMKIRENVEAHKDMRPSCLQALVAHLHLQMMVEYVRKLMKRKLRLKSREEEDRLVERLCEDSHALNDLFSQEGSKEEWLSSVLPGIAEVLKLQDPEAIKLEVLSLAQKYPDIREEHVCALLYLKVHLSKDNIASIQKSLVENHIPSVPTTSQPFYSMVQVKWIFKVAPLRSQLTATGLPKIP